MGKGSYGRNNTCCRSREEVKTFDIDPAQGALPVNPFSVTFLTE